MENYEVLCQHEGRRGIVLIINQRARRDETVKPLIVFRSNTIKTQSFLDCSTPGGVYV